MNKLHCLLLAALFGAAPALAAPQSFAKLTTTSGKTYSGVKVLRVEKEQGWIEISHDGGVARVYGIDLPDRVVTEFGLPPRAELLQRIEAAKQQAEAQKREAAERQRKAEERAKFDALAAEAKVKYEAEQAEKRIRKYREEEESRTRAEQEKRQKFEAEQLAKGLVEYKGKWVTPSVARVSALVDGKSRTNVKFKLTQTLENGALCSEVEQGYSGIWIPTGDTFFVFGISNDVSADGDLLKGDLYWAGTISYTTVLGAQKTIHSFTGDRDSAINRVTEKLTGEPRVEKSSGKSLSNKDL